MLLAAQAGHSAREKPNMYGANVAAPRRAAGSMFAPQHLALLRCTWYATSACRRLQSTTPGSRAGRRLSPVLAGKNDFEDVRDLFGDPPVVDEAQGPNSRTSSKKRCACESQTTVDGHFLLRLTPPPFTASSRGVPQAGP